MDDLEQLTYRIIYEHMQQQEPLLLKLIEELVAAGHTPDQIFRAFSARGGQDCYGVHGTAMWATHLRTQAIPV